MESEDSANSSHPDNESDPSQDVGREEKQSPELFVKVCRKCSVQSRTEGNYCPHCGASYSKGFKPTKLTRQRVLILAIVLVLVGASVATALIIQHSNQVQAEQAAAEAKRKADEEAEAARTRAAEEAAAAKAAQEAKDNTEREFRALAVKELEKSVQKDATDRVKEGVLTGPIKRTACTPLGGGSMDDLTSLTGTFECIAVNEVKTDGSESGYVFSATIDWSKGTYTWHLGR